MSKSLVIFGNGGLSSVVRFYCESIGLKVAGFTVDENYLTQDTFEGLPNVSSTQLRSKYPPENHMLFIAIGASDMLGFVRENKMIAGLKMGYELFSWSFLNMNLNKTISFGENTILMPGCQVDPFVNFGDGVIAWNGSIICHHTTIGDYSFIAPGATICGKVTIGEHCFIGSNATIRDNLCLAPKTLIGAGAVITHDTHHYNVYMPARSIKINKLSIDIKFRK